MLRTRRAIGALVVTLLSVQVVVSPALAAVNVNRSGDENPMKEVAKAVVWGGIAGLTLGTALAVASDSNDNDGELIRWGFAGGTFLGLGMGLWWVSRRPEPSAMLELKDGTLMARVALPGPGPDGRPRLTLARVTF